MSTKFDRKIFFDAVRASLFSGSMTQQQVDGQNAVLDVWETDKVQKYKPDLRWLAYMLATTLHETASTMWPISEYGKGSGQPYGKPDPQTGQTYYGRGFVQLTWRDNYARATKELELTGTPDDLEWHAERALDLVLASKVMYRGMYFGWFRPPNTLPRYFNDKTDDPYGAREIINGDKKTVPSWSSGVSIGNLIKGYHEKFMHALEDALVDQPAPSPEPEPGFETVHLNIQTSARVSVSIAINGEIVLAGAG
jgi:hypothetical protein